MKMEDAFDGADPQGTFGGFNTAHEMKAFVTAHFERLINQKDTTAIADNVRTGYVDHDGPGGRTGVDQSRERTTATLKRLADLRVEIRDILGDGDKVIVRNVWTAFDPERAQNIEMHGFVLFRIQDRQLAERWATITSAEPLLTDVVEW